MAEGPFPLPPFLPDSGHQSNVDLKELMCDYDILILQRKMAQNEHSRIVTEWKSPGQGNVTNKQSYIEKQELKKKSLLAAGLVSERMPTVSSIVLRMTYLQRATYEPVLMKRTVHFRPTDYACFHMDCMREECTNGGFDLTSVITGLVKSRKKSVAGKIACSGKSEGLRLGHASIAYEVSIEYHKQRKKI
jgi:hypothetical protein